MTTTSATIRIRPRRSMLLQLLLLFVIKRLNSSLSSSSINNSNNNRRQGSRAYDYDLIIVGAGAAGLFASGAAALLGSRTLVIDKADQIGGDCTNAACVPSKSLRSVAKRISWQQQQQQSVLEARQHVMDAVHAVRRREDPNDDRRDGAPEFWTATLCAFVGPHEIMVNETTKKVVSSRNFLIATGASPVVPPHLEEQAQKAGITLSTYRTLLQPEGTEDPIWKLLLLGKRNATATGRLLIVGGGRTACELGQSLARLGGGFLQIEVVAGDDLLPNYPIRLQQAALRMLLRAGIQKCHVSVCLEKILPDRSVQLSNGNQLKPVDAILLCTGRSPDLRSLQLDKAGVRWNSSAGIDIDPSTLQSKTAKHVYAPGDCAAAVQPRTASVAAWTGFHAVRNSRVPWILRAGSKASIPPVVPRVIYTDPPMACVGMDYQQCVERHGIDGFLSVYIPEEGSDRADMDRMERDTGVTFIELHATRNGRLLGCTACGPAAAELTNSMGMAITNGLTVRDVARSIHSYPSHGYLIHRAALAMALNDAWGLLEACGPIGKVLALAGRPIETSFLLARKLLRGPSKRRRDRQKREWQKKGANEALYIQTAGDDDKDTTTVTDESVEVVSYLHVYSNATLRKLVEDTQSQEYSFHNLQDCLEWLSQEPGT